ncbi:hypothetical protein SCLCIDRAFT_687486 [Scleroderma citrinum Foug A]|uniref:Uncharacterized protein n=1 Tax=Scleroderma citrinum Foug A TaxID=1036808 RepID=A0A0C2ZQA8_9AGAM|nr:hypothetical protein SCLCIDRAFT_687486 [Scleroderma citrinum Foug A]
MMASTKYDIPIDIASYTVYETVGHDESQMDVNSYYDAIEKACSLIRSLTNVGGICLLFCLRGSKITAIVERIYRLFHEFLYDKRVPVALVITGLEREQRMENWWSRHKGITEKYGISSVPHACITAVQHSDDPGQVAKYKESRNTVLNLLYECTKDGPIVMDAQNWLVMLLRCMATLVPKKRRPKRKDYTRVLVKRCGMDPDAAKKVALLIEGGHT